ncbi:hypothetical protein TNCV_975401 [Trichonephila clavipes]|nr:hypothetical protein TNCV_975401 [Trichonephila clavipes]
MLDYYYFQDKKSPCLVASSALDQYDDIGVNRLNRSAHSSLWNPKENLCDELDRRSKECSNCPKSVEELTYLLQAEWENNTIIQHPNTYGRQAPVG